MEIVLAAILIICALAILSYVFPNAMHNFRTKMLGRIKRKIECIRTEIEREKNKKTHGAPIEVRNDWRNVYRQKEDK